MATVVLPRGLQTFAEGVERIEVQAGTVRSVIRELSSRFPDLKEHLESGLAVSIDGEIINEPLLEPVEDQSEVCFLPSISGG